MAHELTPWPISFCSDSSPSQRAEAPEAMITVRASIHSPSTFRRNGRFERLVSTTAPGNGAPIGGLKVVAASGWFAARPSGTEDVYKLYAESLRGPAHLAGIQEQAREIIAAAIG